MLCEVNDLKIGFKTGSTTTQLIKGISFQLNENEILGVVGESGSGKSITCRALMGLLPENKLQIDAQQLHLLDRDILKLKAKEWSQLRGNEISMIFQEPMSSLNPTVTCGAQVYEVLKTHTSLSDKEIKEEVLQLFSKVQLPVPKSTYEKYPHEISGGQMQRVMIAMAIACKPKILIADEPTTALDVTVQQEIINLIKELQQEYGMSVIFISHDLSLVQSIADRIIVMYQGAIIETGTAASIFKNPAQQYTRALIASRPDPTTRLKTLPTVANFVNEDFEPYIISHKERSERLTELYKKEPLLRVKNVVKDYALKKKLFEPQHYFRAVDDVSFDLFPNESLGLVGESGCGKSTLGNLILGLKPTTSGKIIYKGVAINALSASQMRDYRKELQIIFQDPFASLNPRLTVGQCIMEPMKWHGIGANNKDRLEKTHELLHKVGLDPDSLHKYPHEFSGGQRQRVGIARTIALEPTLIVCDESVSALDISVQAQVLNLLNTLKAEYNFSFLFISHDLAVVKYFCDRIIVMNKGKIEEINEADALYNLPKSDYTKKLIEAIPSTD
jgi:peptide/nickel transport system ATP-binding protein